MSKASIPKAGSPSAEKGSIDWCEHWRLDTQCLVKNIFVQNTLSGTKKPMELKLLLSNLENGKGFTAWAKLKTQNGETFKSFEAFCEAPDPYGLGVAPYSRFRQVLVNAMGDRAVQILLEIEPDGRQGNGQNLKEWERDSLGKVVNPDSPHRVENLGRRKGNRSDRASAIARAPGIAQQLYLEDCLGVREAVKLGPRVNKTKPSQEQLAARARADEVGGVLERWVKDNPIPRDASARADYKRQVKEVVRECFSEPPLIAVRWKANANADAIASAICKKVSPDMLPELIQSLTSRSQTND